MKEWLVMTCITTFILIMSQFLASWRVCSCYPPMTLLYSLFCVSLTLSTVHFLYVEEL